MGLDEAITPRKKTVKTNTTNTTATSVELQQPKKTQKSYYVTFGLIRLIQKIVLTKKLESESKYTQNDAIQEAIVELAKKMGIDYKEYLK